MVSLILVTPHAEESVRIVSKNRWRRIGFDHYEHPRPFSFLQSHSWARIPVIVVCVGYQVSSMGGVSGGLRGVQGNMEVSEGVWEGCGGEEGGVWGVLDAKVSIELRRDRGKRERLINATAHLIPSSLAGELFLQIQEWEMYFSNSNKCKGTYCDTVEENQL